MTKYPVTMAITKEVMDKFREHCRKQGVRYGVRTEELMKKDMEEHNKNGKRYT